MTVAELYDIGKKIERLRGIYAEDRLSLLLNEMDEKEGEFYEFVSTCKGDADVVKILLCVMKTKVFNYYMEIYPYLVAKNEDILGKVSDDNSRNQILEMAGRTQSFPYKGKLINLINSYLSWIEIIIKFYPNLNKPQFGCEAMSRDEFITMLEVEFPWLSELSRLTVYFALKRIGEIPDMEEVVKSDKVVSPNDKQKGRKPDKFSDCIVGKYAEDSQRIIDLMREELVNKRGKAAVEVIYAVMQLGYIRKPTQAEFCNEFKNEDGGRRITANEYTRLVTGKAENEIMAYYTDEEMKRRLIIR